MARPAKLKVYRTPIGFHDAYVAAPSQKAALAAWGSTRDLFARGVAEPVTDPALTEEPLSRPGEVIRRSRGTAAEQMAALPEKPLPRRSKAETGAKAQPPEPKRPPKPDGESRARTATALEEAEVRFAQELRELADQEARLTRQRRDTERRQKKERERLGNEHDRADRAYRAAMDEWQAAHR